MTIEQIPQGWWLIAAAMTLIFVSMAIEARRSSINERRLRALGAIEPDDDVWRVMSIVYPTAFVAMAVESALRGGPSLPRFIEGLLLWSAAKALKAWAIGSLGERWSFRVLVLPNAPLVKRGPYRWLRHPNYVAVVGEFAGAGMMLAAPVAFVVSTALFVDIMRRRILVEERALGIRHA